MKKVLVVAVVGGFLSQFEKNDIKLLQEKGCEIHYAANFTNPIYEFDSTELEKEGISLHPITVEKSPKKFRANYKAIKEIKRIIDEEHIDIVHCHNPMGGACARVAALLSKQRPYVIYTAHGFHFYKGARLRSWLIIYPVERMLAHLTDMIITINKEDYQRACKMHLKKGGKVFKICGVGVDPNRFAPNGIERVNQRKQLIIPDSGFHIVQAAELNDNKNQRAVIEVLSRLNEKNIYYSICGKGPNEDIYQRLIKEYGLEDRIHILGFRTDMEKILASADAFIFPSFREGLGIAAVEALLCGVPIIAGDNRGTREYAKAGYNAVIVDPDNPDELQHAIEKLYKNLSFRKNLAMCARESAKDFTIKEVEKTMRNVYDIALGETDGKTISIRHHGGF